MGGAIQQIEQVAASAGAGVQLIAAAVEIPLLANGAPARTVKLLPIGTFNLRDGRGPYRIRDRAHAEEVVAATRAWLGSADFNWDYNHQVLATGASGGSEAVASGWSKPDTLRVEDDGIYIDVDWTARADQRLRDREFRYLSPLFMARPATDGGDVLHLKNAALTNVGAIDLPAIAASHTGAENNMDLAALLALLGLPADATKETVAAAIEELKKPKAADTSAVAIAAGLAATATLEEVAATVATLKAGAAPDPAKFVPIEQMKAVSDRLTVLDGERAEREVAAAIESGKLAPASKAWGLDYFKKDEAGFRSFIESAPVLIDAGAKLDERKGDQLPKDKLTADEVAAADALGIDHADYLKTRNEELVG
jgi:phage I-like protein